MNQLRRWNRKRVSRNPGTGSPIVKAHAEREEHVCLAGRVIRLKGAIAGDQTQSQWMGRVDSASPTGGPGNWNSEPLCEQQEIASGFCVFHTLPDQDHGPLCRQQHGNCFFYSFWVRTTATRDIVVPFLGLWRLFAHCLFKNVEWHIEYHGARSPGNHRFPCLSHREWYLFSAGRLKYSFAISPNR